MKCSLYGIIGYHTDEPLLINIQQEPEERAEFQLAVGDLVYIKLNQTPLQ